jgi:hypothetical protein
MVYASRDYNILFFWIDKSGILLAFAVDFTFEYYQYVGSIWQWMGN